MLVPCGSGTATLFPDVSVVTRVVSSADLLGIPITYGEDEHIAWTVFTKGAYRREVPQCLIKYPAAYSVHLTSTTAADGSVR